MAVWEMSDGLGDRLAAEEPLCDEQVWYPAGPGDDSIACRKGKSSERQKGKVYAKSDRGCSEGKTSDHPPAMGDYFTGTNCEIARGRGADPEKAECQETRGRDGSCLRVGCYG